MKTEHATEDSTVDTDIKLNITGVQELASRLDPAKREKVLISGLNLCGELLKGWIMRERLSGPRPQILGVVTGRLRSSITTSGTEREGDSLVNTIGTNVEYAPIHEFGGNFRVMLRVRGHLRRQKSRDVFVKRFVGGKLKRDRSVTGQAGVGTHERRMNMPARPFMRPSIEDQGNKQQILLILTEKLQEALSK
jgi:phage gpG-like protein